MAAKISQVKTTRVLHHYFSGMPQLKIAKKCHINQATVSRCAAKFQDETAAKGIVSAAKEYGIMEEVLALRSLAIELNKSKASVEEAKSGLKMVKLFESLGVPPEKHKMLAKAFLKVTAPSFVEAAMNLAKMEEDSGKSYANVVGEYEKLSNELIERKQVIATLIGQQESLEKTIQELDLTKEKKETELVEFDKQAADKKAEIEATVAQKLAEAELTQEKITQLGPAVEKMKVLDISGEKLDTFVEEHQTLEDYGISWEKFQTIAGALVKAGEINEDDLAGRLAGYGSLENTISEMKAELTYLEPQVEELKKEKAHLAALLDKLNSKKTQWQAEVEHLGDLKKALDETVDTIKARRTHIERHIAGLERDVAELENRDKVLTEEVTQKEREVAELDKKLKANNEVSKKLKEKQEQLQELEEKITAGGQKYQVLEGLLGLVKAETPAEIEDFLKSVQMLIDEAKAGKYSPAFLRDYIIEKLAGKTLDLLVCGSCGVEFVVVKKGKNTMTVGHLPGDKLRCPKCMSSTSIIVKKPLAETLEEGFVSGPILINKPGESNTEEKPDISSK